MTPTPNIDSLSGRELDAAVAEKVFESRTARSCTTGEVNPWVPRYSENWSAAALAVERMREMGWRFFNTNWYPNGEWGALFEDPTKHPGGAVGPTMPTAVCRAALKAREAKHA